MAFWVDTFIPASGLFWNVYQQPGWIGLPETSLYLDFFGVAGFDRFVYDYPTKGLIIYFITADPVASLSSMYTRHRYAYQCRVDHINNGTTPRQTRTYDGSWLVATQSGNHARVYCRSERNVQYLQGWPHSLGEFRLYNRSLNASERVALYTELYTKWKR